MSCKIVDGSVHIDGKKQECPFSPRHNECGLWCPHCNVKGKLLEITCGCVKHELDIEK